jgi:hypothetical protein
MGQNRPMQSIELETYFEVARIWFNRTGQRLYQVNNPAIHSGFGRLDDVKAFVAGRLGEEPEEIAKAYLDIALESSNASWTA